MQTRSGAKSEQYHFESLHELGEWLARTPRRWPYKSSTDGHATKYEWDLALGYDGAVRLAREGWIEGAEKLQDALHAFAPATAAPDTRIDFYGFRPHVPRFCAGAPNNMIRHTREAENGAERVLTLLVPINANVSTRASYMSNFGVGVAQYVNQLETQGTRVELIACNANDISQKRVVQTVVVKHADQPLDLAVVAFAIGHPAMFRRLMFAAIERCGAAPTPGYGYPRDAEVSDLVNAPPGTIVLNGMKDANRNAATPEKALAYIEQQIEQAVQAQELPE